MIMKIFSGKTKYDYAPILSAINGAETSTCEQNGYKHKL